MTQAKDPEFLSEVLYEVVLNLTNGDVIPFEAKTQELITFRRDFFHRRDPKTPEAYIIGTKDATFAIPLSAILYFEVRGETTVEEGLRPLDLN